jgi:formate dehydrogenase major subunit
VVTTDTPYIEGFRRSAVEAILENHVGDCLTCAKNTHCKLQTVANYVGVPLDRPFREALLPIDDSNPFYTYDPNKCILCGICVMTCEELMGIGAIDFAFREYDVDAKSVVESRCVSCGECVARCPVGALTVKHFQQPAREVSTTCTYCGVGCGLHLGVRGGKIVSVRGNTDSPVNRGNLCVKGRFGTDFVNHPERLKTPLIRKEGEFVEATWDEALDLVAENFSRFKGDQFGVFSSARCTNEDNYVVQKFTRAVMETNNVDHCARL